jgi:serine protease Do
MKTLTLMAFLLFWTSSQGQGTENNNTLLLAEKFRLNGISTQKAFGKAREQALSTTVRLMRNDKLIAMGGIVDSRGYVLTKASDCVGAREAETSDGKKYRLKIKKRDERTDLALYQLLSEDRVFPVLQWSDVNSTQTGSWVLSSSSMLKEIRAGVTSGSPREIGREGGVMGVILGAEGDEVGGVRISDVVPQAAAYKAGLRKGDVITKVDGRRVKKRDQVVKFVGSNDPGDVVRIEVKRKSDLKSYNVTLGHRSVTFDLFNRNLQMSGPVSKRKDNFPMILQHDLPLPKNSMGGPLFNLQGECIGFNIARVDRVTIYALPSSQVRKTLSVFLGK